MSTAKSMATLYMNGKRSSAASTNQATASGIPSAKQPLPGTAITSKRSLIGQQGKQLTQQRFKSSASNLAQPSARYQSTGTQQRSSRLRSTSMTNLAAESAPVTARTMQRPVSRNALDSIHNGMNAKYAQVQSKVAQQITKPPPTTSKIPASSTANSKSATLDSRQSGLGRATRSGIIQPTAPSGKAAAAASERAQLMAKLKQLEEEQSSSEIERESLKRELERERAEKNEQMQQLKAELQEKLAEHEKQSEEYHQKLLEAYELADQNRRAADSVLSESRQRDEESRKKIEELEAQLGELREFVAMKDEMRGKLYELREQLREERERYEEQLRSLHQVFANEKISKSCNLSSDSHLKIDENSNYFARVKSPALESNESINRQVANHVLAGGCRQCQSGSSQLHRSEQDMYGSKLSTRMQNSAKSAWRRSKQFASSVITGSVGGLTGCRSCTSKQMSKRQKVVLNPQATSNNGGQLSQNTKFANGPSSVGSSGHLTPEASSSVPYSTCTSSPEVCGSLANDDELQHTSVVTVGQQVQPPSTTNNQLNVARPQRSPCPSPRQNKLRRQHQQQQQQQQQHLKETSSEQQVSGSQANNGSLIHVDENNKLTIVTKFNDSDACVQQAPSQTSSNVSVSERSRCESSSSGRGTSSDAGDSANASQNGDALDLGSDRSTHNQHVDTDKISPAVSVGGASIGQKEQISSGKSVAAASTEEPRRHRRKSSLFKASKMFGGSQASLGKLKSIFTGSSSNSVSLNSGKKANKQQDHLEPVSDHLENSRLRCLELNQAISRPGTSIDLTNIQTRVETEEEKDKQHRPSSEALNNEGNKQLEIGQGEMISVDGKMQMDLVPSSVEFKLEMDLMDKVRQVSESYELNKYKALNKTIELDARLSNERLVATKLRLSQVSSLNDKLSKELRSMQQQFRQQEKKLLLTETMLNQLTKERAATSSRILGASARFARLAAAAATGPSLKHSSANQVTSGNSKKSKKEGERALTLLAGGGGKQRGSRHGMGQASEGKHMQQASIQSAATQTQVEGKSQGKTRTIISDLRQRLNLVGSIAKGLIESSNRASSLPSVLVHSPVPLQPTAEQEEQVTASDGKWRPLMSARPSSAAHVAWSSINEQCTNDGLGSAVQRDNNRKPATGASSALRSNSLDDIQTTVSNSILAADESCFVHELPNGQKIIISRGWPAAADGARRKSKSNHTSATAAAVADTASYADDHRHHHAGSGERGVLSDRTASGKLNEEERNRLLMDYLSRTGQKEAHPKHRHRHTARTGTGKATTQCQQRRAMAVADGGALEEALECKGFGSHSQGQGHQKHNHGSPSSPSSKTRALSVNNKAMIVHYDLPVHQQSESIPLASGC